MTKIEITAATLLGLFMLWIFTAVGLTVTTEARCMRAGWRTGTVTWNLERFCITRLDQTDLVEPLWAVEEGAK